MTHTTIGAADRRARAVALNTEASALPRWRFRRRRLLRALADEWLLTAAAVAPWERRVDELTAEVGALRQALVKATERAGAEPPDPIPPQRVGTASLKPAPAGDTVAGRLARAHHTSPPMRRARQDGSDER